MYPAYRKFVRILLSNHDTAGLGPNAIGGTETVKRLLESRLRLCLRRDVLVNEKSADPFQIK